MKKIKENNDKELKKSNHIIFKILLILCSIIIILQVAVFSAYMLKTGGSIKKATIEMVEDVVGEQDVIFCLILGISEDLNINLTDTIILSAYNPKSQKAFLLSIPRDTYIGTNSKFASGNDKINSVYQKNPTELLYEVYRLTGIKVNNYIAIKTKVLREIVDSFGGVEFYVPMDMNYDDKTQNLHIHLKEGNQVLDGESAEQLLRFRHNNNGSTYSIDYGDNDIGRMKTQREFIKVLADKVISLNNVSQIQTICKHIFSNLATNLQLSKVILYIPFGLEFNTKDLITNQLPGNSEMIDELWFYKADKSQTKDMIMELLDELELTEEEKNNYCRFYNS